MNPFGNKGAAARGWAGNDNGPEFDSYGGGYDWAPPQGLLDQGYDGRAQANKDAVTDDKAVLGVQDNFAREMQAIVDVSRVTPLDVMNSGQDESEAESEEIEADESDEEIVLADEAPEEGEEGVEGEEGEEGEDEEPEEPELDEKGRYVLPEGLVYDDWDRPINPRYPERNPFTGEYWGRVDRGARDKRPKYVRAGGYQGREARPERAAHVVTPKRKARQQYIPDRPEYAELRKEQEMAKLDPDFHNAPKPAAKRRGASQPEIFGQAGINMDSYWSGIDNYFDGKSVPDAKMKSMEDLDIDYEPKMPEVEVKGMEDELTVSLESAKGDAGDEEVEGEEGEAEGEDAEASEEGEEGEEGKEGEEGEEEKKEEDPPKLKKEAYMTKAYYMPGYVDKTPEKEYPPHIRAFKNYLKSIGEFEKHGYEKEDYSPDSSSFAPDTSGFAPDTSGFAPDTSSFAPDTSTFRAGIKGVSGGKRTSLGGKIDKKQSQYRPNFGNFKPTVTHMRGPVSNYRPAASNYRPAQMNFKPPQQSYSPAMGNFAPPQQSFGGYRPNVQGFRTGGMIGGGISGW